MGLIEEQLEDLMSLDVKIEESYTGICKLKRDVHSVKFNLEKLSFEVEKLKPQLSSLTTEIREENVKTQKQLSSLRSKFKVLVVWFVVLAAFMLQQCMSNKCHSSECTTDYRGY